MKKFFRPVSWSTFAAWLGKGLEEQYRERAWRIKVIRQLQVRFSFIWAPYQMRSRGTDKAKRQSAMDIMTNLLYFPCTPNWFIDFQSRVQNLFISRDFRKGYIVMCMFCFE